MRVKDNNVSVSLIHAKAIPHEPLSLLVDCQPARGQGCHVRFHLDLLLFGERYNFPEQARCMTLLAVPGLRVNPPELPSTGSHLLKPHVGNLNAIALDCEAHVSQSHSTDHMTGENCCRCEI
jgi:hypothetical protein